jgi:hypothetical protein
VIDCATEPLYPLAEVIRGRWFPPSRGGKSLHYSTLIRWILKGVRGTDGSFVRLEAVRCGSKWCTTRAAAQRFIERLTPQLDADDSTPAPQSRTPLQRRKAAERAGERLEEMGI